MQLWLYRQCRLRWQTSLAPPLPRHARPRPRRAREPQPRGPAGRPGCVLQAVGRGQGGEGLRIIILFNTFFSFFSVGRPALFCNLCLGSEKRRTEYTPSLRVIRVSLTLSLRPDAHKAFPSLFSQIPCSRSAPPSASPEDSASPSESGARPPFRWGRGEIPPPTRNGGCYFAILMSISPPFHFLAEPASPSPEASPSDSGAQ